MAPTPDIPARSARHALRWLLLAKLQLLNTFSTKPITGTAGAVVSLTTYGQRTRTVHLAIESIACGHIRPQRLILWVDEFSETDELPAPLKRLVKRGLEVRHCANYGPHKKYYPYVASLEVSQANRPLIVVDDDFLYPKSWLQSLMSSYAEYPNVVSCTRAHELQIAEAILPYSSWPACRTDRPTFRTFATGVGGVLYPPSVLRQLQKLGLSFMDKAPKADDVWLHYAAVTARVPVRQVSSTPLDLEFKILPFGQDTSLQNVNVGEGQNDLQIKATYDAATLEFLKREPLSQAGI
ncbi:hypothetical protein [Pseudarthrobacter sp. BRE9]|uniref:hypothetical protein n=1 Tax=Pseudarthrobacter sp. BRE9 TaxID=2962582 RepID=UPI002881751C|nr:hypothetical protein [Pseudarthrobacter sp. BRE9]MDT0168124.1 hypothetical protein [Pseudarthrobacter sp. BRE9]